MFKSFQFQDKAILELKQVIFSLWLKNENRQTAVFKSPTGSGKTIMMAELVKNLVYDKEWEQDVAFVWISFSPESAMQSKNKFAKFYDGIGQLKLLDLDILRQKEMNQNDILFVNWQKLKASNKDGRKARNDQPEQYKLSFDNLLANTHKAGRQVVLLIDEAHIQTGEHLALTQDILDVIDPKIILHITATPDEKVELEAFRSRSFVEVTREDVVKTGLIKESLIVMPKEEIEKVLIEKQTIGQKLDLDELLLELAIEKKKELEKSYKNLGKNINPLVLVQLPNEDKTSKDLGEESKEDFVRKFLAKKEIPKTHVATWLSGKQENLENIENNYNHIDYLIFKEAPATGWDCPRASILVMFRDIKKDSFRTQIIGRILRMPESQHYSQFTELNSGYIYTNYQRQEIKEIPDLAKNQIKTKFAKIKSGIENISLNSVFFTRNSYNDLGEDFQETFLATTNQFFGLEGNLEESLNQEIETKLEAKGLTLNSFENLEIQMIVNAKISDFDYFTSELKKKGENQNYQLSGHDLKKMFDLLCYKVISEQIDESRKFAPARSWEDLKTALKVWLRFTLPNQASNWYKIVCNDLLKEDSVLKKVIGQSLENYRSVHTEKVKLRNEKGKSQIQWSLPNVRPYTEDYVELEPQPRLSAHQPFFVLENYKGKQNEEGFIKFLEEQTSKIDWWYKNGDQGKEHFAVSYIDSQTQQEEAFYVDWIIKFKNGNLVGLYDTKGGITAKAGEVKDKAEWLQKYIQEGNKNAESLYKFNGGIVINSGGWKIQNQEKYNYNLENLSSSGWQDLEV